MIKLFNTTDTLFSSNGDKVIIPLSLGNTLNTQENNTQPIEVDNIEPLEEEENEES